MAHIIDTHQAAQAAGWLRSSLTRRSFFARGLAAFGGATVLSLTDWDGLSAQAAGLPSGRRSLRDCQAERRAHQGLQRGRTGDDV